MFLKLIKNRCKQGFTLIEILVVVLIIGVLAAIMLPQYLRAVERSKAVEALNIVNALEKAMVEYLLINGYPSESGYIPLASILEIASIQVPTERSESKLCTDNFIFFIDCNTNQWNAKCEVSARRMNGKTKSGTCVGSGYPMYTIFALRSTNASVSARHCDAYENFTKIYYSKALSGMPTMICSWLKETGQVNTISIHN